MRERKVFNTKIEKTTCEANPTYIFPIFSHVRNTQGIYLPAMCNSNSREY